MDSYHAILEGTLDELSSLGIGSERAGAEHHAVVLDGLAELRDGRGGVLGEDGGEGHGD